MQCFWHSLGWTLHFNSIKSFFQMSILSNCCNSCKQCLSLLTTRNCGQNFHLNISIIGEEFHDSRVGKSSTQGKRSQTAIANNRINQLHKPTLRVLHNDYTATFEDLLEKSKDVTVHCSNLQKLMIEI